MNFAVTKINLSKNIYLFDKKMIPQNISKELRKRYKKILLIWF